MAEHVLVKVGLVEARPRAVGPDEGRRDAVDRDLVPRPFRGEATRQMVDGGLAHAIDRLAPKRHRAGLRADVDDAARLLGDHQLRHRLGGEEGALEIDVDRVVEILLGHVFGKVFRTDADIVDQHVDAAEMLVRLGDGRAHRAEVGEIHLDRERAPPERLDLGDQRLAVRGLAHADDHVGAGTGAGERAGTADAARGAGDQHDFCR